MWQANRARIVRRGVLDIHGYHVHQPCVDQRVQFFGLAAVGIQLDEKAQLPHLANEVRQIVLHQRFTAGEAYAVQRALAFF